MSPLVTLYTPTHSSPHTQTIGPLHCLAVSQQKAAVMSKHLHQPLRGLASNPPVINRTDERTLLLHVASVPGTHVCLGLRVQQIVAAEECVKGYEAGKAFLVFTLFCYAAASHMSCLTRIQAFYLLKSESIYLAFFFNLIPVLQTTKQKNTLTKYNELLSPARSQLHPFKF